MRWFATPKEWREPPTLERFLRIHQLTPEKVASYELEDGFESGVATAAIDVFKGKLPEVLHAIFVNATNSQHAKQSAWMEAYLTIVKPQLLQQRPFDALQPEGEVKRR